MTIYRLFLRLAIALAGVTALIIASNIPRYQAVYPELVPCSDVL